jgi:hypothetical protein
MTAPGWVLLLEAVLRKSISLPNALCRTSERAHVFDGANGEDVAAASAICRQCPEIQRCRDWASGLSERQLSGVVAGEHREWYAHRSLRRKNKLAVH